MYWCNNVYEMQWCLCVACTALPLCDVGALRAYVYQSTAVACTTSSTVLYPLLQHALPHLLSCITAAACSTLNVYIQNHWSTALKTTGKDCTNSNCALQRRRERFTIIYIYKITQHMVPNISGTIGHTIKTRKHPRHRTQCVIQYPTNRNPAQSLQEDAITVFGPRLYNSLPKYLWDIENVKTEKFKLELDKFFDTIPDQSKMPNYVTHQEAIASSTSSPIWGLKEFTTMVESPTRPWCSLSCFEATRSN